MSVVDFGQHAQAVAGRIVGPLLHGELDGLLEPLSQDERRDVRDMLDNIARQLAARAETTRSMRTRLDAVIASLIGVVDAIDGDCDIEPNFAGCPSPGLPDECEDASEDEGAQCEDEGERDDNGIADADGLEVQGFGGLAESLHLHQAAALIAVRDRGGLNEAKRRYRRPIRPRPRDEAAVVPRLGRHTRGHG